MVTLILNSMEGPLTVILAASKAEAEEAGSFAPIITAAPQPVAVAPPFDAFAGSVTPAPLTQNQTRPGAPLTILKMASCEAKGQGAEVLIPTIAQMLKELGMSKSSLARIAAVRGPGSFTGIRLLLTTAFGLTRALTTPASPPGLAGATGTAGLAGMDYLPILAHTAAEYIEEDAAIIWVLTHARRGQVNLQGFEFTRINSLTLDENFTPLGPALYISAENAAKHINSHTGNKNDGNNNNKNDGGGGAGGGGNSSDDGGSSDLPVYATGTGLYNNIELLKELLSEVTFLPQEAVFASPCSLLAFAQMGNYTQNPIEPLYLRDSEAEENLAQIAANLGLDPSKAKEDLLRLTGKQPGSKK